MKMIPSSFLKYLLTLTERNAPTGIKFSPESFLLTVAIVFIDCPTLIRVNEATLETAFENMLLREYRTTPQKLAEKIIADRKEMLESVYDHNQKKYTSEIGDKLLEEIMEEIGSRRKEKYPYWEEVDWAKPSQRILVNEFLKALVWYKPTPHVTKLLEDLRNDSITIINDEGLRSKIMLSKTAQSRKDLMALSVQTRELYDGLTSIVFGQEKAIRTVAEGYFNAELELLINEAQRVKAAVKATGSRFKKRHSREDRLLQTIQERTPPDTSRLILRNGPRNVFLFAGPPGVGKTFLARQIGKYLKREVRIFDMTRFTSAQEGKAEFVGSDSVFTNSQKGDVTEYVDDHPDAVVVFDEIEKAHRSVQNLFLQILEGGKITDVHTRKEVSFLNNIVIFTTNAGRTLYDDPDRDLESMPRSVVADALLKDIDPTTGLTLLPPELCSRLSGGSIIMFNHISAGALHSIAKEELEMRINSFSNALELKTDIGNEVCSALLYSLGGRADARLVRGRSADFFTENIYKLADKLVPDQVSSLKQIEFRAEIPTDDKDVAALFNIDEPLGGLVFGSFTPVSEKCTFTVTTDSNEALKAVTDDKIRFVIADMSLGEKTLDLVKDILHVEHNLPIWLVRGDVEPEIEREYRALKIAGTLPAPNAGKETSAFSVAMDMIADDIHRDDMMIKLARSNKELSFITDCKEKDDIVTVTLRGMKLVTAVRAEDRKDLLDSDGIPEVKFDDVIGAKDAKEELKLFAKFLREPKKFARAKLPMPKGVILYGPPGTGKTMLAKAMAAEAGVPFIPTEGNRFKKKYSGEGAALVHEIFARARSYAPCVLFVDEVDSIAAERTATDNSLNSDVLNAFLTEMDGFRAGSDKPVFVLCATNFDARHDDSQLDKAFLRRFDNRIFVRLPDRDERRLFMQRRMDANSAFSLSAKQLDNIADRSVGMSLDNIDSVFDMALRMAVRHDMLQVTDDIIDKALEEFNYGSENNKTDRDSLKQTACHESGHAIVSRLVGEKPAYITIVSRGNFGGYMRRDVDENKGVFTKQELLDRICVSLGGRAAELVIYGETAGINTGASSDIANATAIARNMICGYGMDHELGMAVIGSTRNSELEAQINRAVNRILTEQLERAKGMLVTYRDALNKVSSALYKKNSLTGADFEKIFVKACKK